MASAQEKQLMEWIRANLGRLPTDIQQTAGAGHVGPEGINLSTQQLAENQPRFSSAELSRLLPGANIYASQAPGAPFSGNEGMPGVGRGGMNFRIGNISAMYNPDGTLADVVEHKPDSFMMKAMRVAMPAVALGAFGTAALGANAAAGAASSSATGAGHFGGISAGASGQGLSAGAAGVTGITAPSGFVLAPELGAAAGSATGGYFGGLNPQSGVGLQAPSAPNLGTMGGAQGIAPAAPAAVAPALAPQSAAVAPSLATRALSFARSAGDVAGMVGPAMSLLGSAQQVGSLPQAPAGAPTIPGVEAPPTARAFQASSNPLIDILGRNRQASRNRTQLTSPGGVSMESVRARGNSLLGLI